MRNCNCFVILLLTLLLVSCKEETRQLESRSPDGTALVRIDATRSSNISAWRTSLRASKGNPAETGFTTDIYCKALDSTEVRFNWMDNRNLELVFNEKDGAQRRFLVLFDENTEILIREIK
jgi:uncharacterized protein YcfL